MAQAWNSSKRPGQARPTIISYRSLIMIFFSSRTLVPEFLQTAMLAHALPAAVPVQHNISTQPSMASSKSQASKGVDKRKREKVDQEDPSHKKKRRQKQQQDQDGTPRASPKRKPAASSAAEEQHASEEDSTFTDLFSKHKPRSQSNGESTKSKALQKWRISEPMGGRMSEIDPIFSADEK